MLLSRRIAEHVPLQPMYIHRYIHHFHQSKAANPHDRGEKKKANLQDEVPRFAWRQASVCQLNPSKVYLSLESPRLPTIQNQTAAQLCVTKENSSSLTSKDLHSRRASISRRKHSPADRQNKRWHTEVGPQCSLAGL